MIHGKRVIVVLPAYNAARTLEKTYAELPLDVVDEISGRRRALDVFLEARLISMQSGSVLQPAPVGGYRV